MKDNPLGNQSVGVFFFRRRIFEEWLNSDVLLRRAARKMRDWGIVKPLVVLSDVIGQLRRTGYLSYLRGRQLVLLGLCSRFNEANVLHWRGKFLHYERTDKQILKTSLSEISTLFFTTRWTNLHNLWRLSKEWRQLITGFPKKNAICAATLSMMFPLSCAPT